jgi:hypothetical protein
VPVKRNGVEELLHVVADASDKRLPEFGKGSNLTKKA